MVMYEWYGIEQRNPEDVLGEDPDVGVFSEILEATFMKNDTNVM